MKIFFAKITLAQIVDINLDYKTVTAEVQIEVSFLERMIEANETRDTDIELSLDIYKTPELLEIFHTRTRFEPATPSTQRINELIKGEGAMITVELNKVLEFYCKVNFNMYPFQRVRCEIGITTVNEGDEVKVLDRQHIRLAENFAFPLATDYEIYYYPHLQSQYKPILLDGKEEIEKQSATGFLLVLNYHSMEVILIYYLPAFIMVCLSLLSFLIPSAHYSYKVILILLSLLNLENQLIGLNKISPKGGSGPTAAAVYLLGCTITSTLCLCLNIVVFRWNKYPFILKEVNFYSGLLNVVIFILFNILYWSVLIPNIQKTEY